MVARNLISVLFAYLIGSLPIGVWISRWMSGRDIREMGDGNTGARNITHVLGWKAGILVAFVDFTKGVLAILAARQLGVSMGWQFASGLSAVIGHDFPILAEFKGGQGMATSLGTMSVLAFYETVIGLLVFGLVYLILRHFEISAAIGLGTIFFLMWKSTRPMSLIFYTVGLFLSIPLKKYMDYRFRYLENIQVKKA